MVRTHGECVVGYKLFVVGCRIFVVCVGLDGTGRCWTGHWEQEDQQIVQGLCYERVCIDTGILPQWLGC